MHPELFLTNIGYIVSIVICLSLGVFVFFRGPKKSVNIVFLCFSVLVVVWLTSYVTGINLYDPYASRTAFMFNMSTLILAVVSTHLILVLTERIKTQKPVITLFYVVGFALSIFFIFHPDSFLLPSTPQLYLPNFFVPGPYYYLGDIFFFTVVIYFLSQLYLGYHHGDRLLRTRLKYFIVGFIFGYGVSLVPLFLLYGMNVDPLISCLTGLYTIPMAYAILKYDLIELHVAAKQAFGYAVSVALIALLIILLGYTNDIVISLVPQIPRWILPLVSGIIAVATSVFVWKKVRENDRLKFEFIDVATHKFRTPITQINWSVETLKTATDPKDRDQAIENITYATAHLLELTNMLVGVGMSDSSQNLKKSTPENIGDMIKEAAASVSTQFQKRNIKVITHIPTEIPTLTIDRERMQTAFRTLMENAATYSKNDSEIVVAVEVKENSVLVSFKDSGIGISKEDLPFVFTKFFRTEAANRMNTEGMGIGLFIVQNVINANGGTITAESEGVGKGSTFIVRFPLEQ